MRRGHSVRVVQTPASLEFVGRASFEGITGAPVLVDEFERDPARGAYPGEQLPEHDPISHLELVRRCDAYCIAPASANTIAKLATGIADNLLTSAYLACTSPVVVAPAMNNHMYEHPATQANLAAAARARRSRDRAAAPARSPRRGEWGVGRLAEPPAILSTRSSCSPDAGVPRPLDGLRVLVTAGGTREPLDAVRFVGNRSSGRMGLALAEEAARRGADVTVVAANVTLPRSTCGRLRRRRDRGGARRGDARALPELRRAADGRCRRRLPAGRARAGQDRQGGAADFTVELVRDRRRAGRSCRGPRAQGRSIVGFAAEHGAGARRARARQARAQGSRCDRRQRRIRPERSASTSTRTRSRSWTASASIAAPRRDQGRGRGVDSRPRAGRSAVDARGRPHGSGKGKR